MVYKMTIVKEKINIEQNDLGKQLLELVHKFRNGEIREDLPVLMFLVKEFDTHSVFYKVSFYNDPDEGFYDIFVGSYVLQHSDITHRLIEIEDEHEANYHYIDELYKKLENEPCYTLEKLIENGYEYFYSKGFDASEYSNFKEYLDLL